MIEPKYRAAEGLAKQLGFTEDQLDLVGRCLGITEGNDVVRSLKENDYTNSTYHGRPLFDKRPGELNPVSLSFLLNDSLRGVNQEEVKGKIKKILEGARIPYESLFTYCKDSYGLELDNLGLSLHFGF